MMRKVSSFLRGWGGLRGQRGFTLVEVLFALVISGLLMFGTFEIVRHMVVTSTTDRYRANALLQVQYVGFWISEDVMQARLDGVCIGGTEGCDSDYFLNIEWTEWDGDKNEVIYRKNPIEGEETYELSRQQWYTPKGGPVTPKGTSVVGEFLDSGGTSCEWVTPEGNGTDVLKLTVAANVDGQTATRIYEISPRSR